MKVNKREFVNLVLGTFLIVLFFILFTSIMDSVQANDTLAKWYKTDLYADHHHVMPSLTINQKEGKPGSYFELTGGNYPTNSTAIIVVNGTTVGTVQVNNFGCFVFQLSTAQADDGAYFVTVGVNPKATTSFRLDSNSPHLWPQGIGTTFAVPAGIAFTESIHLPVIVK